MPYLHEAHFCFSSFFPARSEARAHSESEGDWRTSEKNVSEAVQEIQLVHGSNSTGGITQTDQNEILHGLPVRDTKRQRLGPVLQPLPGHREELLEFLVKRVSTHAPPEATGTKPLRVSRVQSECLLHSGGEQGHHAGHHDISTSLFRERNFGPQLRLFRAGERTPGGRVWPYGLTRKPKLRATFEDDEAFPLTTTLGPKQITDSSHFKGLRKTKKINLLLDESVSTLSSRCSGVSEMLSSYASEVQDNSSI